jgi:hypothetical protein
MREGNVEDAMTEAERARMLALLAGIEAELDGLLDQLDGLLAACDRAELEAAMSQAVGGDRARTLH